MKKTLLFSTMLSLAVFAQAAEPVLIEDWRVTTNEGMPSDAWGSWARACGGYNGELYVYQANGTLYKFGKGLNSENVVCTTSTFSTDDLFRGSGPHFDDAGNAVFLTNYTAAKSGSNLKLWNTTTNALSDLVITLPEGYVEGRMDYIGKPIGDLLGEGGVLFLYGKGNTSILKVNVANGTVLSTKLIETGAEAGSVSIAQPLTSNPESDDVIYRIGTSTSDMSFHYKNGEKWAEYESVGNIARTGGGAVVTLEGKLYTIEPSGDAWSECFQVVDRVSNKLVASHNGAAITTSSIGSMNISVEQVDNKTAYIYQLLANNFVARYTLTTDETVAIEEVEVDANAPVEYYNLQGVKVANPEKGLFIKKQGNKATKVVL